MPAHRSTRLAICCTLLAMIALPSLAQTGKAPPARDATLYDAAVFNDRAAVERLLARDPASVNQGDQWGFTPLHGVAGEEHTAMARLLIARGANVNASNGEGITPLHAAASPAMVKLLIEAGAHIDARDRSGNSPLHIATEHPEMLDVMAQMLKMGANPNAANKAGETPLDVALMRQERAKVALLRRHGAQRGNAK
ncbi:ankyrin repeat domain-containing protein [Acidovorax sp.]|uniref:ankyrin repeat domain-containing protein n=1 Tax=Acidovorax sp. TaxID=1872122 RepID=UPI002ACE31CF|nr:ankyrin repeat domain-containing protein [Acidovorax sp.]MDZ7863621.1 ankyrin repeat domain-containing protein [Acidovorax sp.]